MLRLKGSLHYNNRPMIHDAIYDGCRGPGASTRQWFLLIDLKACLTSLPKVSPTFFLIIPGHLTPL